MIVQYTLHSTQQKRESLLSDANSMKYSHLYKILISLTLTVKIPSLFKIPNSFVFFTRSDTHDPGNRLRRLAFLATAVTISRLAHNRS